MIKILVYEDNNDDLVRLLNLIELFFQRNQIEISVESFSYNTHDLSSLIYYDIIFLDMELENETGIQFGEKILNINPNAIIIITSAYPQYLIDGYKIEAKRFFLKPIDQALFNHEMSTLLKSSAFKQHYGFIDKRISDFKILYKDILYIEFYDRATLLHLISGKIIRCPYSLKYWLQLLEGKGFSQPYRSYIVNLTYVIGFTNDERDIFLTDNERIPISKNFKKKFETEYYQYLHTIL